MSRHLRPKLGLAIIGAVLFLLGVRRDDATLRWVGIGWFAAAFLIRFVSRAAAPDAGIDAEASAGAPSATEGAPGNG